MRRFSISFFYFVFIVFGLLCRSFYGQFLFTNVFSQCFLVRVCGIVVRVLGERWVGSFFVRLLVYYIQMILSLGSYIWVLVLIFQFYIVVLRGIVISCNFLFLILRWIKFIIFRVVVLQLFLRQGLGRGRGFCGDIVILG